MFEGERYCIHKYCKSKSESGRRERTRGGTEMKEKGGGTKRINENCVLRPYAVTTCAGSRVSVLVHLTAQKRFSFIS